MLSFDFDVTKYVLSNAALFCDYKAKAKNKP